MLLPKTPDFYFMLTIFQLVHDTILSQKRKLLSRLLRAITSTVVRKPIRYKNNERERERKRGGEEEEEEEGNLTELVSHTLYWPLSRCL